MPRPLKSKASRPELTQAEILANYYGIVTQIRALEAERSSLALDLKETVWGMPGHVMEAGEYRALVYERENKAWDYDKAVEILGKRVVNQICKISTSRAVKVEKKR